MSTIIAKEKELEDIIRRYQADNKDNYFIICDGNIEAVAENAESAYKIACYFENYTSSELIYVHYKGEIVMFNNKSVGIDIPGIRNMLDKTQRGEDNDLSQV